MPITYQDQYFSLMKIQVWSVLLDFRFRLKQLSFLTANQNVNNAQEEEKEIPKQSGRNASATVLGDRNAILNTTKLGQKLPFQAQTVADFFFADETGSLPEVLNFKEVDLIYNDYIRVMTCMHQKLKHTYNQFCLKLLTEE